MFDICLAGTGGTMPLKNRWLTNAYLRCDGKCMLIDCGEGTQIALKEAGLPLKPIELICITHFHADHISGLIGLLLSMGNDGRTEPLYIIGPRGLESVVTSLRVIAPELPFDVLFKEITSPEQEFDFLGCRIKAFAVKHAIPCFGYSVTLARKGRFDPQRAEALGLPKPIWGLIQKNGSAVHDGVTYTSDMVMGPDRRGLKFVYCTDTRPCQSIVTNGMDADLMILEGMHGEPDKQQKAAETFHMTFAEAAEIGRKANVRRLWLTHFSPSMPHPEDYSASAAGAYIPHDGEKICLRFDDE